MEKEKTPTSNGVRWSIIIGFIVVFILLVGLCVYHFHQVDTYSDMLAIYKSTNNKSGIAECNWQIVGNSFFAIFDILFVAFLGYICCILDKHHTKLLQQSAIVEELNKTNCPKCGTKIDKNVLFCSTCGNKMHEKPIESGLQNEEKNKE